MKNGLTKAEAKSFLDGAKRGRKVKYDWAKIVHELMAGASVRGVAKAHKMSASYVSFGSRKYAKKVLASK